MWLVRLVRFVRLVRHGLRDDECAAADPYQSQHVAWDVDESFGFDRKQQEQSGDHEGEEQKLKAGKACLALVRWIGRVEFGDQSVEFDRSGQDLPKYDGREGQNDDDDRYEANKSKVRCLHVSPRWLDH